MRPLRKPERGLMLLLAVISIGLVMLLLSSLVLFTASRCREEQAARVRAATHAAAGSVAAYARRQLEEWSVAPPAAPVQVDIRALLTAEMTGSATARLVTEEDRRVCRVQVEVSRGSSVMVDEFDLAWNGP